MAVQVITSRFEVDFSDHERFNELLRQEARNTGVVEDSIGQDLISKSVKELLQKTTFSILARYTGWYGIGPRRSE